MVSYWSMQFQSFLDLMWHLLMVKCGEEEKVSIVVTTQLGVREGGFVAGYVQQLSR